MVTGRSEASRRESVRYDEVVDAVAPSGMVVRGGFAVEPGDGVPDVDGNPARWVVIVGNIGGALWPRFRAEETPGPDPLDRWTRATLAPIATRFGAAYLHPSDRPFWPVQRWAQRADIVAPSPIGLLIHPTAGLWHAYRGALVFAQPLSGVPERHEFTSPCVSCRDQPCLAACPVDAIGPGRYDVEACRGHLRRGATPDCLREGCAARCACPVGAEYRYGPDQMLLHMRAFAGGSFDDEQR